MRPALKTMFLINLSVGNIDIGFTPFITETGNIFQVKNKPLLPAGLYYINWTLYKYIVVLTVISYMLISNHQVVSFMTITIDTRVTFLLQ